MYPGNKKSHLVARFACRQSEHRSDFGSLLPKITNYANAPTIERHGREGRGRRKMRTYTQEEYRIPLRGLVPFCDRTIAQIQIESEQIKTA